MRCCYHVQGWHTDGPSKQRWKENRRIIIYGYCVGRSHQKEGGDGPDEPTKHL